MDRLLRLMAGAARLFFALISLFMMLLATALILYAATRLFTALTTSGDFGQFLLDSIGYTIIAIAVFEVAKYIFEEGVLNPAEMRHAGEARRSMTKFISTIAIAVFLEALVAIFQVMRGESLAELAYPTFLLMAGGLLIVGLGLYQRLSATAERLSAGLPAEQELEDKVRAQQQEAGPEGGKPLP